MTSAPDRVLVGGYTAEMGGHAAGIASWARTAAGSFAELATVALNSPSYLITHPGQPWIFAVIEGSPSQLLSLRVQADGSLVELSRVPTGGDFGCHLTLSPDVRHVVVAHYGSGSVSSFEIDATGVLSERRDLHQFTGSGTDPERQEGPHAHHVMFDAEVLLVADLGTDRLHQLRLHADGTFAAAGAPVELPRGTGPRHLVLVGGDHLVVVGELSAELWLGVRTAAGWAQAQTISTSIAELNERIAPSAIRADGDTIYVANRGSGTIAVFTLDRAAHTLTRVQEFSCGGPGPRDLVLRADQLWVANQTSDLLSVFHRNAYGAPRAAFQISSPNPACVVLLDPEPAR